MKCPVHGVELEYLEGTDETPDGALVADNWYFCPVLECDFEIEAWRVGSSSE